MKTGLCGKNVRRRNTAKVMVVIYAFSNVFAVHGAEKSFWDTRRSAVETLGSTGEWSGRPHEDLFLRTDHVARFRGAPGTSIEALGVVPPYGTVAHISSAGPGSPVVFLIQDLHSDDAAQKNIGELLGALADHGIDWAAVEGAVGPVRVEALRAHPVPRALGVVAEHFRKAGYLSGPEWGALVSRRPLALVGVESAPLYRRNTAAARAVVAGGGVSRADSRHWQAALTPLKKNLWNTRLIELSERTAAYEKGTGGVGEFVLYLVKGLGSSAPPTLSAFAKAVAWEKRVNQRRVDREYRRLTEALTQRLDQRDLRDLLESAVSYRAGRLTQGEYFEGLSIACRKARLELRDYPSFLDYLEFVGAIEALDRSELLREIDRARDALAVRWADGDRARALWDLAADVDRWGRLTEGVMTPEDWLVYEARRDVTAKMPQRLSALGGVAPSLNVSSLRAPAETFCRTALARNGALAENTLAEMRRRRSSTAVLVAGGFHAPGLTAAFKAAGCTTVVITPRAGGTAGAPLDVFARDPLPLEKLFAAPRVSLAPEKLLQSMADLSPDRRPVAAAVLAGLVAGANLLAAWGGMAPGPLKNWEDLLAIPGFRVSDERGTIAPHGASNWLRVETDQGARAVTATLKDSPPSEPASTEETLEVGDGLWLTLGAGPPSIVGSSRGTLTRWRRWKTWVKRRGGSILQGILERMRGGNRRRGLDPSTPLGDGSRSLNDILVFFLRRIHWTSRYEVKDHLETLLRKMPVRVGGNPGDTVQFQEEDDWLEINLRLAGPDGESSLRIVVVPSWRVEEVPGGWTTRLFLEAVTDGGEGMSDLVAYFWEVPGRVGEGSTRLEISFRGALNELQAPLGRIFPPVSVAGQWGSFPYVSVEPIHGDADLFTHRVADQEGHPVGLICLDHSGLESRPGHRAITVPNINIFSSKEGQGYGPAALGLLAREAERRWGGRLGSGPNHPTFSITHVINPSTMRIAFHLLDLETIQVRVVNGNIPQGDPLWPLADQWFGMDSPTEFRAIVEENVTSAGGIRVPFDVRGNAKADVVNASLSDSAGGPLPRLPTVRSGEVLSEPQSTPPVNPPNSFLRWSMIRHVRSLLEWVGLNIPMRMAGNVPTSPIPRRGEGPSAETVIGTSQGDRWTRAEANLFTYFSSRRADNDPETVRAKSEIMADLSGTDGSDFALRTAGIVVQRALFQSEPVVQSRAYGLLADYVRAGVPSTAVAPAILQLHRLLLNLDSRTRPAVRDFLGALAERGTVEELRAVFQSLFAGYERGQDANHTNAMAEVVLAILTYPEAFPPKEWESLLNPRPFDLSSTPSLSWPLASVFPSAVTTLPEKIPPTSAPTVPEPTDVTPLSIPPGELDRIFDGTTFMRWQGRTALFKRDGGILGVKFAREAEDARPLLRESGWMAGVNEIRASDPSFPGNCPSPFEWKDGRLFRGGRGATSASWARAMEGGGSPVFVENGERVFTIYQAADEGYFSYLEDLSDEEAGPASERALGMFFALARRGKMHPDVIPIFHGEYGRLWDSGLFLWATHFSLPSSAGRLRAWPRSVRFSNFRRSGLADFENLVDSDDLETTAVRAVSVPHYTFSTLPAGPPLRNALWALKLGEGLFAWSLTETARRLWTGRPDWRDDARMEEAGKVFHRAFDFSYRTYVGADPGGWTRAIDWTRFARQMVFFMGDGHKDFGGELLPDTIFSQGVRIVPGEGWGWIHESVLRDWFKGVPEAQTSEILSTYFQNPERSSDAKKYFFRPGALERITACPDPALRERLSTLYAKYGTGWRHDGIHPDLGPFGGSFPCVEMLKAVHLYTLAMMIHGAASGTGGNLSSGNHGGGTDVSIKPGPTENGLAKRVWNMALGLGIGALAGLAVGAGVDEWISALVPWGGSLAVGWGLLARPASSPAGPMERPAVDGGGSFRDRALLIRAVKALSPRPFEGIPRLETLTLEGWRSPSASRVSFVAEDPDLVRHAVTVFGGESPSRPLFPSVGTDLSGAARAAALADEFAAPWGENNVGTATAWVTRLAAASDGGAAARFLALYNADRRGLWALRLARAAAEGRAWTALDVTPLFDESRRDERPLLVAWLNLLRGLPEGRRVDLLFEADGVSAAKVAEAVDREAPGLLSADQSVGTRLWVRGDPQAASVFRPGGISVDGLRQATGQRGTLTIVGLPLARVLPSERDLLKGWGVRLLPFAALVSADIRRALETLDFLRVQA